MRRVVFDNIFKRLPGTFKVTGYPGNDGDIDIYHAEIVQGIHGPVVFGMFLYNAPKP